jgi:DNA invertase Pin-like site-specific DNA recombinase
MLKRMKTTSMSFVKRNCYSYTRFSSSQQAEGDSYRRQIEKAQKFCADHKNPELELNEMRFEDLGVSGWTGENIEKGALGDFIAAVKANKIPKGSCLLVENWDRFSRLKPMEAYNKVGEIINAGVDVVTLEDGKFHTAENYHDFTTFITSLIIMQRANEESSRKSSLIRAAYETKRKLAKEGKDILSGNRPPWLKVNADKTGFEFRPERVAILLRIIRLVKEGKGKREIARMLDAEGVPTWGADRNWSEQHKKDGWASCWRENYILEAVKSRALVGELRTQQRKEGGGEVISNYYPSVIDEATWQSIQPKKIKSFNAGPQSDAANLFTGLLHDGYHPNYRMKFFMQNKAKGYVYLSSDYATVDPLYLERQQAIARGEEAGPRPQSGESIRYNEFEKHFLQHFSEIDILDALPKPTPAESSRVGLLEKEKADNDKALANLVKALEKGEPSAVVMEQINKREAAARRLAKELETATAKQRREQYAADSFEQEHQRIIDLMEANTRETRLSLRSLFHRIIERIDIYTAGLLDVPDDLKEYVWPDRNGMKCYSVKLVGSHKIWIWWDGCQVWE